MKRIFLLVITGSFLMACSFDGKPRRSSFMSQACNRQVDGFTMTAIHYGDARIFALPLSKVRPNTEFRFLLIPKHRAKTDTRDFATVDVTVNGKNGTEPWLGATKSFNAASKGMLVGGCVPDNAAVGSTIHYEIHITDVGYLDPRADVVWR